MNDGARRNKGSEKNNNNFKINHRNYENGLNVAFASGERFMPTSSELRGDCVS